jgi:hypothetical protein
MMSPRIELLGIQRRRAVSAHQNALRGHGAGSVARDTPTPLIHIKAVRAVRMQATTLSIASNEAPRCRHAKRPLNGKPLRGVKHERLTLLG